MFSKRISREIQKYRYTGCTRVVAFETSDASNPSDLWTEGDLFLDVAATVEKERRDDSLAECLICLHHARPSAYYADQYAEEVPT